MAIMTGPLSDIKKIISDQNKEFDYGFNMINTKYSQINSNLEQSYDQFSTSLKTQRDVNISGAYTNYKRAAREVDYAQGISQGFKENLTEAYENQFDSDYTNIKTQYLTGERDLLTDYTEQHAKIKQSKLKELGVVEDEVTQLAETTRRVQGAAFDYLNQSNVPGYSDLTQKDMLERGFYEYQETEDGKTQLTLTDAGRAMWHSVFYEQQGDTSFTEHLRQNNPDLWEKYLDNPALIQKAISGLDQETHSMMTSEELFPDAQTDRELDIKLSESGLAYSEIMSRKSYTPDEVVEIMGDDLNMLSIDWSSLEYRSSSVAFKNYLDKSVKNGGFAVIDANGDAFRRKPYLYVHGKLIELEKDEFKKLKDIYEKHALVPMY